MAGHFCKEHGVAWFKTEKMKGYAHPIKDTEGNPLLDDEGKQKWCNEPKEKPTEELSELPEKGKSVEGKPVEKYQRGSPEERNSIESQVAFKGLIELMVGKIINSNNPLFQTALNYASSKLGYWSSIGTLPDNTEAKTSPVKEGDSVVSEKMITPSQIKELNAVAKEQGYGPELAMAIMIRLWHKTASKTLTKREADEFISVMKQGLYLDKVDPENLPF